MKNSKQFLLALLTVCVILYTASSFTVFARENNISTDNFIYDEDTESDVSVIEIVDHEDDAEELIPMVTPRCGYTSVNQMQHLIDSGQAPSSITGCHLGFQGQQPHVHFSDGTAMNLDGTPHHGSPNPSKSTLNWLNSHGWC